MNKFQHKHHAHCESGVISSMLTYNGLPISEPMVFGVSNTLNFAYIPFIKMGGMPLIAYRSMPKSIVKNLKKNLRVEMKMETFKSQKKGEERVDELLKEGKILGAQGSMYWLEYVPEELSFHFNAHNFIIFGKKKDTYLISDPVFQYPMECSKKSLTKARFSKGVMAPKGLLYYPTFVPKELDLKSAITKNIKKLSRRMLSKAVPIAGISGMKYLAHAIVKLDKRDKKYAKLFLGNIVRMQEEIGTGGAGFRFMYASFLQEASEIFGQDAILNEAAQMMLQVGDEWREFALMIAKAIKSNQEIDFKNISSMLLRIASNETKVYKKLLEFGK